MWARRKRRRRLSSITKHYTEHKEQARKLVQARLMYFNQHYGFEWNRVAIRNQRRCWGSCSSQKNLNFSYKLLLLPSHLCDYIIVHELCHLQEMNHGPHFWSLVAETIPDYKERIKQLKQIERLGQSVQMLEKIRNATQTTV